MSDQFVTLTADHAWGRGETVKAAKAEARRQGGTMKSGYIVFKMPPGAVNPVVDQMGTLRWDWAEGADTTAHSEVVESNV